MYQRLQLLTLFSICFLFTTNAQEIPLKEHPRPDFERKDWMNLNGKWDFKFDPNDEGISNEWSSGIVRFESSIMVPFPWGSELSQQEDEADIGWYKRQMTIPSTWKGKKVFLIIGAADWHTSIWLNGKLMGKHQGGYVPIEVDLTDQLEYDTPMNLVIRVDDKRRDFTLYGKQGYGNARGIWQTVYLEARGNEFISSLHFVPDIDKKEVLIKAKISKELKEATEIMLSIKTETEPIKAKVVIPAGKDYGIAKVRIPNMHLWSLDDPYLYEANASMGEDEVATYFGMRKISVVDLPGSDIPYIALNNEPVYLQLALDQSYHPDGFYTFPSDQFMKEEIERSKAIGLNGIRIHIKVEVPRKLYWADKLGLLVMADLPNSWGEPDEKMRAESTYTLKRMIDRDYNHPSIFSWIIFNETWGLRTNIEENGKEARRYLPETQSWVASMYYLAKSLDPTRLVEDNSICCGAGHTETDIYSWHVYLPGWAWEDHLANLTKENYAGSSFDFEDGFVQGNQPNINSECGNVWGYDGSAGDVDWSYDYHRMINTFRKYPKVAGWLYTEHHDVINEWNGYWRFDRSEKETGMGDIVEGMDLNDLHAKIYVTTGNEVTKTVKGGTVQSVPIFLSAMSGEALGDKLQLAFELETTNYIGETEKNHAGTMTFNYQPWMQEELRPIKVPIPDVDGLAVLRMWVKDMSGNILSRNFMHFEIQSENELEKTRVLSKSPAQFSKASFSKKQWNVREGRKANGAGKGSFSYVWEVPSEVKMRRAKEAYFIAELSAKELFVKDMEDFNRDQDYMKGSRVAPSANPNAYPMTDETFHPSRVSLYVNGQRLKTVSLEDDPADHRGILSWHHQLKDKKLREAGSYGYLMKVPISKNMLRSISKSGKVEVEIRTEGDGGLAVYGKEFGRYPIDPSIVLKF